MERVMGSIRIVLAVFLVIGGGIFPLFAGGLAAGTAIEPPANSATGVENRYEAQSTTNLVVAVSGTVLPDGGEITTTNNPTLSLELASDSTVEVVSVRIDGTTSQSYVPNATTLQETTTLNLDSGSHQLSIIVRTADSTMSYSATVIEDSAAPLMTFESPISAGFVGENGTYEQLNESYTLNQSSVRLTGNIQDQSAIKSALITRTYNYEYGGPQTAKRQIKITELANKTISQHLRLGPFQPDVGSGVNTLTVELRDEFGHIRTYETEIRVTDTAAPNITIAERKPVATRSAVKITAQASDRVGLTSVGFRLGPENGSGQQYIYAERNPMKQAITKTVTPTIDVIDGTRNITLLTTDYAGETTAREVSVNYTELVTPQIQFNEAQTGSVGPQTVQVAGRVDAGQITRVRVETLGPDGDTLDLNSVYSGGITENVSFTETLTTDIYPATIQVRAVDTTGTEHTKTIEVAQSEPIETSTGTTTQTTPQVTIEQNPPLAPIRDSSNKGILSAIVENLEMLAIGVLLLLGGGMVYTRLT
ncbi:MULTISPECIES: hypothetical protein [Halobacterium]|uniref:hypothetical protein n=1 Tax=Halobacterium TaxID=2239 RepID=UPI0012FBAC4C|nr:MULTISPECIES: hypothetical protein [Halobacterium]MCG1004923.1 hypothetical protein [Halobacterium noricense]